MKNTVIILLLSAIVSSCTSTQYFQLFKTTSSNLKESQGKLYYEDDRVKIYYNLWAENGNPGFIFYNNTDSVITLNKDMSFYIQNGLSYDYFQNRTYTVSSNSTNLNSQTFTNSNTSTNGTTSSTTNGRSTSGVNSSYNGMSVNSISNSSTAGVQRSTSNTQSNSMNQGTSLSRGVSITVDEPSKIKIAPHSGKVISEFSIVNSRFSNCDLLKFPQPKKVSSLKFTEQESPVQFSNIISYELNGKSNIIQNSFFVNEISNLSSSDFYAWRYDTICGKQSAYGKNVPKLINPNWFFIEYNY
jgi:hypothetical protein